MPPPGLIDAEELIRYLRERGFDGPEEHEGKQFMTRDNDVVHVPNPHMTKEYYEAIIENLGLEL